MTEHEWSGQRGRVVRRLANDRRIRLALDPELDSAVEEVMAEMKASGMMVDRAQCSAYLARLGLKARRDAGGLEAKKPDPLLAALNNGRKTE
jgi:hypothetical protein